MGGGSALSLSRGGAGAGVRGRRRLQQEMELHSKGKGDNSWRKDPEMREEQKAEDIEAAAASQSDKVRSPLPPHASNWSPGAVFCEVIGEPIKRLA